MKLKLKEDLREVSIYIPFENRSMLGKFIDERLYTFLNDKFPDLFELVCEKCDNKSCKCNISKSKKRKTKNDISIDNTEFGSDSNIEGEIND